jgi:hypothetical protein
MVNWDKWIFQLDSAEITEGEKKRARNALCYLKSIIGNNIERNHPIMEHVYENNAPWVIQWLIEFASATKLLSIKKGGNAIIKKLSQNLTFSESVFHVYVSNVLFQGGFEVEFVKENNAQKVPDLRLTHIGTKRNLCLELTEIDKSVQQKKNEESFSEIFEALNANSMVNRLYFMCEIHRYLSKPVRNNLLPKIQRTINTAHKNGFSSLKVKGKINLALADVSNYSKLNDWSRSKGFSPQGLTGSMISRLETPDPQPDKLFTIGNKIKKKRLQFDKNVPNGLVIKFDNLFIKRTKKEVKSFIEDLEQYVYDFEDLDLLLVVDNHVGGFQKDMILTENNNLYLVTNTFPIQKQVLLIMNDYSVKKDEARLLSNEIKKAFEKSNTILF